LYVGRVVADEDAFVAERAPLKWFVDWDNQSDFVKALAEPGAIDAEQITSAALCLRKMRRLRMREGYCFHHVQPIMLTIDQYAASDAGQSRVLLEQSAQNRADGINCRAVVHLFSATRKRHQRAP
jgi:hypothetical protein